MCEQTEINYLDGEVVWVKLGSCWWPGEVVAPEKLPPDVLPSFRKAPIAVVKFFQEDTYEYVKNINFIYKYNCSRKNEFINKGLYMYRSKRGQMEKFPEDIIRAETAVGGDLEILSRDEFQETKKPSYAGLFGDAAKKTPGSVKKGKSGRGRITESPSFSTPIRQMKEKANYKVHILLQGSKTTPCSENITAEVNSPPSTSCANTDPQSVEDKVQTVENENLNAEEKPESETNLERPTNTFSTPTASSSGVYACHACPFSTSRLNVLILHSKSHSVSFTPYTPSPVRKFAKKVLDKSSSSSPKVRRPRKETDKPKKSSQGKKRPAEDQSSAEVKKPKTDEEIKSSLLADWDDIEDESNDESSPMVMVASPEVPVAAESPAVPTPAELPSAQIPTEISEISAPAEKKIDSSPTSEKPETSSDCKYEFCEDEDWPLEADAGRKIPRVKNPKRKEDTKSLSLDEDDVAREVAELLNKTIVPELPSVPEPLKVEENFPEPSIVKSPDKNVRDKSPETVSEKPAVDPQPTKAIFKTKTFFRSRHSRSQDAIGKYVAEQLNAVERMDISEIEVNGSDAVSSPEARDSPPIEPVKVARLAPKIQLKKMKAEAAQLREKERNNTFCETLETSQCDENMSSPVELTSDSKVSENVKEDKNDVELPLLKPVQDVLYPTQEIRPVNTESSEKIKLHVNSFDEKKTKELYGTEDKGIIQKEVVIENVVEETTAIQVEDPMPELKLPESDENQKSYEQLAVDRYMNESTASAVDALLSVSREADRVTRVISDDPPDELFEDDNKDGIINEVNDNNGIINEVNDNNGITNEVNDNNGIINEVNDNNGVTNEVNDNNGIINEVNDNNGIINEVNGDDSKITKPEMDLNVPAENNEEQSKTCEEEMENNVEQDKHCEENEQIINDVAINKDKNDSEILDEETLHEDMNEHTSHGINTTTLALDTSPLQPVTNDDPPSIVENVPSESDLQIAETLISLPATAIQIKATLENPEIPTGVSLESEHIEETSVNATENMDLVEPNFKSNDEPPLENVKPSSESLLISNNENINFRYETEQEKCENLNAAQSLVQMSESVDHKITLVETKQLNNKDISEPDAFKVKQKNGIDNIKTVEQKVALLSSENSCDNANKTSPKFETSSSKLLKILEEPCAPKITLNKTTKQIILPRKEKILNFDVAKSSLKGKALPPKQKIIIRRTTPSKNIINNNETSIAPDKIILSRTNNPSQDGSVQTYTIQTSPEAASENANTIIIQQKIKKITKPPSKLQKIKPHNSLIMPSPETKSVTETAVTDDAIFDINSMPIVLSEDLITPESIDKMPIVMSDGNIITKPHTHTSLNPPKLVKTKQAPVESDRVVISPTPSKPEVKTLLVNPVSENKVTTPNILSKSSKLRGGKPMLLIDKTTGKQKIIMTKAEPAVKEVKQTSTVVQSVTQTGKTEKFIILPTPSTPRPGRTQKIVIDPQTGKAHVLVTKGPDTQINTTEHKPVSAKLMPSSTETNTGNTVMIITNAQGAQSRILLTPEHEKILFPNKQQPNVSQLKAITHRITTAQKTAVSAVTAAKSSIAPTAKTQTRIVPKQKSAIITSKGQLILGGRVATTAQNIAPMPEIRPVPKRIVASEPKKLVQTIQKTTSEPLIFLQQKSGAMMQLTAAQFEHLQKTGQIVQKSPAPVQESQSKIAQRSLALTPNETAVTTIHKTRVRKSATESPMPVKKFKKQEIPIAPAPSVPVPALTPISNHTVTSIVPSASNTVSVSTSGSYSEFENFEELLPSTAIVRQPEIMAQPEVVAQPEAVAQPEMTAKPEPSPLSDGQLVAVPGEPFGGPPGSFYLCFEDGGTLTPIDNRPLVLENNQLVPMAMEPLQVLTPQPERRDILEAALANSDVFQADTIRDEVPDFRDLNANVSVHCRVSETSTTLHQPIMTPLEMPTKADSERTVHSNLEDGLAVIGVTPHSVPTSLELPITVTDPRIAPKTTDPLSNHNYGPSLLPSPNTEMTYVTTDEPTMQIVGPISMPLLTDDESVGKSMPILTDVTDEVAERTVSSMGSTEGSPASDVRESETEDGGQWTRRLLTPGSDISEASSEIPLQPAIQLSINELSRGS